MIDNVRCRFDKMSSMTMTAPATASGRRGLSYRFDGKVFDYDLGPAVKPSGKVDGFTIDDLGASCLSAGSER
ncbi:MAG: hypothetical protein ACLR5G_17270 [Eubacteriales bacterium]